MADIPKYQQIKRDLQERIDRGDYDPDEPFTTQRELCDRYGVSMLTAARALTELQQEGVLVSSRGRGTFVARRPRATSGDRPVVDTITCIVPALSSGDIAEFVRGVQRTAANAGFTTTIVDVDGSWDQQRTALQKAITSAAVVLWPVDGPSDARSAQLLHDSGVPVVFADRYWPDFPAAAVVMDNYEIGLELTERLIGRGFRRIATLWFETSCTAVRDRAAGHLQALRKHDIPIDAELAALRDFLSQSDADRRALLRRIVDVADRTAFVCANGFVLEAAVDDALSIGLDVPGAVDFAGTDRKVGHRSRIPPLTAVTAILPTRAIGERAASIACDAAIDGALPDSSHETIGAEFQEREDSPLRLQLVRQNSA